MDEDEDMLAAEEGPTQEGGGGQRKESFANLRTAKIFKTMVKALLRILQDQRDLASCCIDVLIGPAGDSVFKQMSGKTKEYSKLSKEAKETSGTPHLFAFVGLIMAIIENGPSVGQANYETIKAYAEQVKHMAQAEMNEQVRLCKQARCYNEQDRKFFLEMGRCPVHAEILAALTQMAFKRKGGRAPPSHLKRELVEWLQQL